jgi:hypothetical protein
MSSVLVEKIRKARQVIVPLEGTNIKIICRRPTDLEIAELRGSKITQKEAVTRFVEGWEGVTELDLFAGGTGALVPFTPELYAEWIADNPKYWGVISGASVAEYKRYSKHLADSAKN